jgi:hypothetical protein
MLALARAARGAASRAAMSSCRVAGARAASTAFFTKEHEYARVDGKVATCGITHFAQSELGDVVYVSLPEVGATFKKGFVRWSALAAAAVAGAGAGAGGPVTTGARLRIGVARGAAGSASVSPSPHLTHQTTTFSPFRHTTPL